MGAVLHVEPLEVHPTAIGPLDVHLRHRGGELAVFGLSAACVVGWADGDEDLVRRAALDALERLVEDVQASGKQSHEL